MAHPHANFPNSCISARVRREAATKTVSRGKLSKKVVGLLIIFHASASRKNPDELEKKYEAGSKQDSGGY